MIWLLHDWRGALPSLVAGPALALVAVLCGVIIGTERERREKAAGLRTLMLVSLGSAAFTMASFAFTSNTGDSGRVAAQIVTGIGFLGAGVILHGRNTITGTTTAATIWVTAAVGMIAGAGQAAAALGLSGLVRLVLAGVSIYERYRADQTGEVTATLDFEAAGGTTRVRLERVLANYRTGSVSEEWTELESGESRLTLRLHLPRMHLRELLDDLVNVAAVRRVQQTRGPVAKS